MIDILSYKLGQKSKGISSGGGVTIINQNKTITSNGTYTADSGYTGLGVVKVDVPQETAKILPLTITKNGTYEAGASGDTLTWDGNIEGREYIDLGVGYGYCKVCDDIPQTLPSMSDVATVTSVNINSGEIETYECVYLIDGDMGFLLYEDLPLCIFALSDLDLGDDLLLTKGIYFVDMDSLSVRSVTINGYTGFSDGADGYSPIDVNVTPTLQEKTATENGEVVADSGYDGLSKVVVNVQSGSGGGSDLDALIEGTATEISSNATMVRRYTFYEYGGITSIDLPNATSIGENAFYYCSNFASGIFPNVTTIGSKSFQSCSKLASVYFPKVTTIKDNAFASCVRLLSVDFPKVTTMEMGALYSCKSLKAVILRSETMCAMANTNALGQCSHILGTVDATYNPNGDKDGYIYVPRALVDTYKSATNWTTYATQFRALEDYTVDGTITGELDPNKI